MLLGDFFRINQTENIENGFRTVIELNPKHRIFEGHFPIRPITPGVCLYQIVKEVFEQQIGKKLRLFKGDTIKFMNLVEPKDSLQLTVEITYKIHSENSYQLNASIKNEQVVFCKFIGVFQLI
jgi:3-hydroxyacyl-[acyl-carrier-protein] dehydratase